MNLPKVNFIYNDLNRQANYLCFLAKQIACGSDQHHGMFVLPKLIAKNARTIYFPLLNYTREFWDYFKYYNETSYVFFFPKEPFELAEKLLPKELIATSWQGEKEWKVKEKEFFTIVTEFFPKFNLSKVAEINVLVTKFGTVGSFYIEKLKGNKLRYELTVREDFRPAQIAETILTLSLHLDAPKKIPSTNWFIRESIVDFLMTETVIGQIFDFEYQPTVSFEINQITENFAAESSAYLTKLGFPLESVLKDIDTRFFTQSENRILTGLIARKNQLITYDQIGELFWGKEEADLDKFNLYSIAKIMEKIRKKIKNQGIYKELIYTIRGQGYVLYD